MPVIYKNNSVTAAPHCTVFRYQYLVLHCPLNNPVEISFVLVVPILDPPHHSLWYHLSQVHYVHLCSYLQLLLSFQDVDQLKMIKNDVVSFATNFTLLVDRTKYHIPASHLD